MGGKEAVRGHRAAVYSVVQFLCNGWTLALKMLRKYSSDSELR